jgi:hypothetical protein
MNELIEKLKIQAGITEEQATKSLEAIKDFVKEKFPMLGGAVDNIFKSEGSGNDPLDTFTDAIPGVQKESWMDKISDVIPGEMGEKAESFTKRAADTAEDAFDKAKIAASETYDKAKLGAEDLMSKAKIKYDDFTKK